MAKYQVELSVQKVITVEAAGQIEARLNAKREFIAQGFDIEDIITEDVIQIA